MGSVGRSLCIWSDVNSEICSGESPKRRRADTETGLVAVVVVVVAEMDSYESFAVLLFVNGVVTAFVVVAVAVVAAGVDVDVIVSGVGTAAMITGATAAGTTAGTAVAATGVLIVSAVVVVVAVVLGQLGHGNPIVLLPPLPLPLPASLACASNCRTLR